MDNTEKKKSKTAVKVIKRISIVLGVLLLAGIIFVFAFLPKIIEKGKNPILEQNYNVTERAKTLHNQLDIADLHTDSLLWSRDLNKRNDYGHVDIPRLIEGNVALQAFTVVTKSPPSKNIVKTEDKGDDITLLAMIQRWPISSWGSLVERAVYQSQKLHDFSKNSNNTFYIIKSQNDLNTYLQNRKQNSKIAAGFLGLEGQHALENDINNLDKLYKEGYRMMSPTHFFDNEVAGSAQGVGKKGLTEFGQKVISRMDQLNIIIDLAHASPETVDDVLKTTKRPVLVSHTGVKGVIDNYRNLSDDHIKQIAKKGGLIGIMYWDEAIGGNDVKSIVRSIRYVYNLVGADYVALGSDYDGNIKASFDVSGMVNLTQGLIDDGFSDQDIKKIMGDNVIKFMSKNLPRD